MHTAIDAALSDTANSFVNPIGLKLLTPLLVFGVLALVCGCAGSASAGEADSLSALRQHLAKEVADYEKESGAIVGLYVTDIRSGEEVMKIRQDDMMKPGSNQKLLTSALALAELGPDFEFSTRVYRKGDSVYVVGDGDSTLGAPEFVKEINEGVYTELDRWAAAIKAKVGEKFSGDLVICSDFDASPRPPFWSKHIYKYSWAPATGGLNFSGNLIYLNVKVEGEKVSITTSPESRLIRVENKLTVGENDAVTLTANDDDSVLVFSGTVTKSSDKPRAFPINQPELYTGRMLAERLAIAGVNFGGKVRFAKSKDTDLTGAELLYEKKTPIAQTMKWMNIRSLNMPAECHMLRSGDGQWQTSADMFHKKLIEHYQLDWSGFVADEGAGISSVARVTPRQLVKLLQAFLDRKGGEIVIESLPRSGMEGTFFGQLKEPQYRGRARGKIGHVQYGYCLSGYILDKKGKPVLVYSIMANAMPAGEETKAKPMHSAICKLLVDYVDE